MIIEKIQQELQKSNLDGFIAYNSDKFCSEYIGNSDKRIEFVTNFTDNLAVLVILKDKAGLFIQDCYIEQAKRQVTDTKIEIIDYYKTRPSDWIKDNCEKGARIGFDSWLCSARVADEMEKILAKKEIDFVPSENLIDKVWEDKPSPVFGKIELYDIKYAGQTYLEKLSLVRQKIQQLDADYLLLSSLDDIAWLFNLRGEDVENNPVFYSFAIVGLNKVFLYTDTKIEIDEVYNVVLDYFSEDLKKLKNDRVIVDYSSTVKAITSELDNMLQMPSPCKSLKAVKNLTELKGAAIAQEKEGVVFVKLFSWLNQQQDYTKLKELDIVRQIELLRSQMKNNKGDSFPTICGVDSNAGVIHYIPTLETNRALDGKVMLIDSGGQYLEGTTDMTRTISLDKNPAKIHKQYYTLVLKGHLAIARAKFPKGVRASQLDTLARQFLWQEGLDYNHSTGHGVGSYLSVHEAPPTISPYADSAVLEAGMIVSNEPGVYNSSFGIRIENVIQVIENNNLLEFKNLTMIPYDKNLIETKLLTKEEVAQINKYHKVVFKTLKDSSLNKKELKWLKKSCCKI